MKLLKGRFRLSIRLDYTVVPIDLDDLLAALLKEGYTVGKVPVLPVGTGSVVEPASPAIIARIGETTVDMDLNRGIFGLETASSEEVVTRFTGLLNILEKELNADPRHHTWFVEFVADLNIQGSKTALDAMKSSYSSAPILDVASKAVGEPSSFFGFRIGSQESTPSGINWFDIRIEPLLRNAKAYYVSFVYRNSDASKVLGVANDAESKAEQLIDSIESDKSRQALAASRISKTTRNPLKKSRSRTGKSHAKAEPEYSMKDKSESVPV